MSGLILFGRDDHPDVRRVAVTLLHHLLPFERQHIPSEQLRKVAPTDGTPLMQITAGQFLFDVQVMLEYAEAGFDDSCRLMPANPRDRVAIGHVDSVSRQAIYRADEILFHWARSELRNEKRDPQPAPHTRRLQRCLAWLEEHLYGEWLIGERMTAADVSTAVAIGFIEAEVASVIDTRAYPKLKALAGRCEALPCFERAHYMGFEAVNEAVIRVA